MDPGKLAQAAWCVVLDVAVTAFVALINILGQSAVKCMYNLTAG